MSTLPQPRISSFRCRIPIRRRTRTSNLMPAETSPRCRLSSVSVRLTSSLCSNSRFATLFSSAPLPVRTGFTPRLQRDVRVADGLIINNKDKSYYENNIQYGQESPPRTSSVRIACRKWSSTRCTLRMLLPKTPSMTVKSPLPDWDSLSVWKVPASRD